MTVTGETRVLPEDLPATWERLAGVGWSPPWWGGSPVGGGGRPPQNSLKKDAEWGDHKT